MTDRLGSMIIRRLLMLLRHVAKECQKPKQARDLAYRKKKMLLRKAHYMYMAKIQKVALDAADNSGPIFDAEPLQKIHNCDDNYNVFSNEKQHLEQPESVNDIYLMEQCNTNITSDSSCMSNNSEEADQDDQILQKEHELLVSLIKQLKAEIDASKQNDKALESSNKALKTANTFLQRVISTTSVSRPQLKRNQLEDKVLHNNSQGKKHEVEDHRRIFEFSNNKMSATACNDSLNVKTSNLVEIILFIIDSGCSKNITGNIKLLSNFVEIFLGTVKFGNNQFAPILGYRNLVQVNATIKRVYYIEGLNHNLISICQFCNADLEVAFWKSAWYVCDLIGNDLFTGSRGTDLYSITLQDTTSPNPICLMAKATSSQAWLWHRRLSPSKLR
nr:integrase, catalytic region, zinc finger, CCHC-type, peptidase aspartic, catalytic [Tanacetum cinerariifolium]